jgi:hypothetical protein
MPVLSEAQLFLLDIFLLKNGVLDLQDAALSTALNKNGPALHTPAEMHRRSPVLKCTSSVLLGKAP